MPMDLVSQRLSLELKGLFLSLPPSDSSIPIEVCCILASLSASKLGEFKVQDRRGTD